MLNCRCCICRCAHCSCFHFSPLLLVPFRYTNTYRNTCAQDTSSTHTQSNNDPPRSLFNIHSSRGHCQIPLPETCAIIDDRIDDAIFNLTVHMDIEQAPIVRLLLETLTMILHFLHFPTDGVRVFDHFTDTVIAARGSVTWSERFSSESENLSSN